ncbi:MAG: DEAD/DEAH box helicase family protein [Clostridiales bacterium]|nr:DEAD/DEAH box helicase family protein [Clostridiales bacterium]
MSFSLDTIKNFSANEETYLQGKKLYEDRRVKIESVQSFWKGEISLKSSVTDENGLIYPISVTLSDDRFEKVLCTCKDFEEKKKFCKHLVATLVEYYRMLQKKSPTQVITSKEFQTILKGYTNLNIEKIMKKDDPGEIFLIPKMILGRNDIKLSFKVANEKKNYVIKDLTEFYLYMKRGEFVEYGKSLSFHHSIWSFHKSKVPMVEFLLKAIEEKYEYYRQYNPYKSMENFKQREMVLLKADIDKWMKLLMNDSVEIEFYNGVKKQVQVINENPDLEVEITENVDGGYSIYTENEIYTFFGENHLYVYRDGIMYCCSKTYTEEMGLFLREVNSKALNAGEFKVNHRDMSLFVEQMLPIVSKHMRVHLVDIELEQFVPKAVEATFTFDIDNEKGIVCVEELNYEDFSFNPLLGSSVPISINRDYLGEYKIRSVVEKYFDSANQETGQLYIKDEEKIYNLLESGMSEFTEIGRVYVSDSFRNMKILLPPKVTVGVSLNGDLLELEIDSGEISEKEILEILEKYKMHKKFHRLKSGEFINIENLGFSTLLELAQGLRLTPKDLKMNKVAIPKYRALYLESVLSNDKTLSDNKIVTYNKEKSFIHLLDTLENIEDADIEIPKSLDSTLKEYQKVGFRWIKTLSASGLGGILADEMGLGKTLQVIAVILSEKQHIQMPSLIVCPASLVYNWENELLSFAPTLKVSTITGNALERREIIKNVNQYDVLITSYDLLRRDILNYNGIQFLYEIIDEAQYIKNHTTKNAKAVKKISAKTKFALTGTPIENRLSELWSIFDFLMPGFLYSYKQFKEELELPIVKEGDELALRRLQRMIHPFVLRRLKKDVLKELPEKLENIIYSKLEGEQKKLYIANALRLKSDIEGKSQKEFQSGKLQILSEITRLRQICCDPSLCYDNYKDSSGKLETCMELVHNGIEAGHKMLLFSQFTSMLSIIEKRLIEDGISYFVLTGATPKKERFEMAEKFNNDDTSVFLISLKAGGIGLNLTGADFVIHYDPWWNLAVQNQATDRAHRIGQKKKVAVFKLITKNTIEENILKLQENKNQLANQVISDELGSFTALTKDELMEVLL